MQKYAQPSDPFDFAQQEWLTPKEAATYLRVSKSYLDKLRVYAGGPRFGGDTPLRSQRCAVDETIPSIKLGGTRLVGEVLRHYVIERTFCRLKDSRRIATRYDKLARNFLAGLYLVIAICYWI